MRALTYFVAVTADGFIARPDGGLDGFPATGAHLDWIAREYPETIPAHLWHAMGVSADKRRFDTVLMGRRTYEVGLDAGIFSPYPHLRQYVVSRTMPAPPHPDVGLVSHDPAGFVRALRREAGGNIWLCGGASLAGELYGEIDEVVLKINPVLFGNGIPLFRGAAGTTKLERIEERSFDSGVTLLRYRVMRN